MLLGSAYGKVGLDTSGLQAGVTQASASLKTLQSAGEKIGGALKSAGQALTLGVTLPVLAAGTAAVKLASDLEETKRKVKVIFGDMSGDMLKWAESANTSLGQTRAQALDAASTFALFGKVAGKSGDDLNKFAQQNVGFAADFASFYNTNPEEAIIAIGAAYRGESEPIRKYNILLNDQVIKSKAVTLGLYAGTGALSQQARIMAVNALITEQGSAAMGDFARTSGGLANQSRILSAQLKDSLAMLGQNLLPMVVTVVKGLNDFLTFFQKLPVPVQQAIIVFFGFLAVLGPFLTTLGSLIQAITTISGAWPMITAAVSAAGPAFTAISAVVTGTVLPALGAFIGSALAILGPILIIIAALYLFYKAFDTNFMGITDTVKMLPVVIPYLIKQMWDAIVNWFVKGWDTLKAWVIKIKDGILDIFKIDWGQIGRNIISGMINGLISGIGALVAAAKRTAEAALQAFKDALGIHSPSVKFALAGKMSGLGYVRGLQGAMDPSAIARIATRPVQTISRSAQQNNTYQFGSGLSLTQARAMQSESEQRMKQWTKNMLGV